MSKFKVGDLVKYKKKIPEAWGVNCYKVDFVDEESTLKYRMIGVCKNGMVMWESEDQLEEYIDSDVITKTAEAMMRDRKEVETVLMNNDKELKAKAELYDKICEKLFMATGIIEDGNSIQYIIDPEIIVTEIIKIITEIPDSRKKQIDLKRMFVRSIGGAEW